MIAMDEVQGTRKSVEEQVCLAMEFCMREEAGEELIGGRWRILVSSTNHEVNN